VCAARYADSAIQIDCCEYYLLMPNYCLVESIYASWATSFSSRFAFTARLFINVLVNCLVEIGLQILLGYGTIRLLRRSLYSMASMRRDPWDLWNLDVTDQEAEWYNQCGNLKPLISTHQSPPRLLLQETHSDLFARQSPCGSQLGSG